MGVIWVTSSRPGADRLAKLLEQHGYSVWNRPVIEIRDIDPIGVKGSGRLMNSEPDLVIVVSQHAAQRYVDKFVLAEDALPQRNFRKVLHLAVGAQTAAVLNKHQLPVKTPEIASSEGLLAMTECRALTPNQRVWVISGADGREVLAQALDGVAEVVEIQLYRRCDIWYDDVPVAEISTVVASSVQSLNNVHRLWGASEGGPVQIIVPSERVASEARSLGFQSVINAHGAQPQKILECIAQMDMTL